MISQSQSHNHTSQEVVEGSKTIIIRVVNIRLKILFFSFLFLFLFQFIFYFRKLGLGFSVILYVTVTHQSHKSHSSLLSSLILTLIQDSSYHK